MAYLDPGVGSYILQILIATFAVVGFGLKIFWGKIRGMAARVFSRGSRTTDRR